MSPVSRHWVGWAVLMLVTGLVTLSLHRLVVTLLPEGLWHQPLSALFVVVVWPALAWSVRAIGRWCRCNTLDAAYVVALLWC